MNGLLLVAGREVRQRWKLLPVALAVGFLSLALGPLVGLVSADSVFLGVLAAELLGLTTALLLGATVIAGELGSGRLGFYFARPLAWWDIWGGKLLSSFLLAVAATILAAAPPLIVRRVNPLTSTDGMVIPVVLSAMLLGLGAAHAASVAWRSRSGFLLVDLTLLVAAALVLRGAWPRVVRAGLLHTDLPPLGAIALLLAVGAALFLAASAAQVSLARTDLRRGHVVLSMAIWIPIMAAVAALDLVGRWAVHPALGDLVRSEIVYTAPAGSWIAVSGPVRGRWPNYWPTFLMDTATGRSLLVRPQSFVAFTPDGERAAWLDSDSDVETGELRLGTADLATARLSSTTLRQVERGNPGWFNSLAFSPEKDRLLVAVPTSLAVYAVNTGERVAFVAAPPGMAFGTAFFDGPRTIRALRARAGALAAERTLEIVAVGLPEGSVQVTGRIERPGAPVSRWVQLDAGSRVIILREKERSAEVLDGRTGDRIADLALHPKAFATEAGFLSDGRIVLAEALPSGGQLRLFGPDGREQAIVPVGPTRSVHIGGEPRPDRLAVGLESAPFGPSDLALVDTKAARVVRVEKGLGPPRLWWLTPDADPAGRSGVGRPGASIFLDGNGAVVRLDPESGERRMILPGAPRGGRTP
jgi:hypothetical protein